MVWTVTQQFILSFRGRVFVEAPVVVLVLD